VGDEPERVQGAFAASAVAGGVPDPDRFAELVTCSATLAIASTRTVPLFAPGAARPAGNDPVIIEFLVDDVDGVHRNLGGFVEDFVTEPTTMPWSNRSLLPRSRRQPGQLLRPRHPRRHRQVRPLTMPRPPLTQAPCPAAAGAPQQDRRAGLRLPPSRCLLC
jgi:hypothetical protein